MRAVAKLGLQADFLLIFDRFLEGSYGVLLSQDGHEWREAQASFPDITRNGSRLNSGSKYLHRPKICPV